MNIGNKVKIKWNGKIGEVVDITLKRINSPYLIKIYLVKDETGKIDKYEQKEIRNHERQ